MRYLLTDRRGKPLYSFRKEIKNNPAFYHHKTTLWYAVQNRDWPAVVRRAASHPHEIVLPDPVTGNTVLHWACRFHPPVTVVQALKECCDSPNSEGATPLHVAASHRCSAAVLQVLVAQQTKEWQPTAQLTRMGRSPMHYACMSFRGLSLEAFCVLLEATLKDGFVSVEDDDNDDGKEERVNVLTLRDARGQTPLALLFRRYRERVRCVIQTIDDLRKRTVHHPNPTAAAVAASVAAAMTVQADLGELWEKARWMVARLTQQQQHSITTEAAAQPVSPGERAIVQNANWMAAQHAPSMQDAVFSQTSSFRIVHASVGLTGYGCPPEMIQLALSIHPNQVFEMDNDGNLPLHIAAMAPCYVTNNHMIPFSINNNDTGSVVSGWSCSNPFDRVIRLLLTLYPDSAKIPHGKSGKLPLAMAKHTRTWEDGFQTLLQAYPPALHSLKLPRALYPLVLEKLVVQDDEDDDLVTLPDRPSMMAWMRVTTPPPPAALPAMWAPPLLPQDSTATTLYQVLQTQPDLVADRA